MADSSSLTHLANLQLEDASEAEKAQATAAHLLQRCQSLLLEIDQFRDYLLDQKKAHVFFYNDSFRTEVKSELGFLLKAQAEANAQKLSSSNLPFYEHVWAATKRSSGVRELRGRFSWDRTWSSDRANSTLRKTNATWCTQRKTGSSNSMKKQSGRCDDTEALIDIVTDDGELWIKVSYISEKRLIFELAKLGWHNNSADDSDEDMDMPPLEDLLEDLSLFKAAKSYLQASRTNPIRGTQPRILLVLPRIHSGSHKDFDDILAKIESFGVEVQCANDIAHTPPLEEAFPRMLVDVDKELTSILNIDCTVLLALVSDISHQDVEDQPWLPRQVRQQIEREKEYHLLPDTLYPVLGSRRLVCTVEAAKRMLEIVSTIGTDEERARTMTLLGLNPDFFTAWDTHRASENDLPGIDRTTVGSLQQSDSDAELRLRLSKHSIYEVPVQLQLPIKIVDETTQPNTALPPVAETIQEELRDINRSVFMFGWALGYTTVTSNGAVTKQIEKTIFQNWKPQDNPIDSAGPQVWLCTECRSLVAKKGRGDHGTTFKKPSVKPIISDQ